jgi:hypothetical protein
MMRLPPLERVQRRLQRQLAVTTAGFMVSIAVEPELLQPRL